MATCEYVLDTVAYQMWQAEQQEEKTATEIAQQNRLFNLLVTKAIHNELSETDAEILKLYFYKGYTQRELAELFGVNVSTISRRIDKSLNTLYEKLKYAAEYRFGVSIVNNKQRR